MSEAEPAVLPVLEQRKPTHETIRLKTEDSHADTVRTIESSELSGSSDANQNGNAELSRDADTEDAVAPLNANHRYSGDRLESAIQHSLLNQPPSAWEAAKEFDDKPSDQGRGKNRSITLSINGSRFYLVPWVICKTWQGIEEVMKLYFADNSKALRQISMRQFEVRYGFESSYTPQAIISPEVWEHVIEPLYRIEIWLTSPADIPVRPEAPESSVPEEKIEYIVDSFENKVGYTVTYYEKDRYGGNLTFLGKSTYDAPIEFEVEMDSDGYLSVLEEKTVVESPWTMATKQRKKFEERGMGQKAKLGELDRVSTKQLKINSPFLLNVLRSAIEFSSEPPSGEVNSLSNGVFHYPFKDLYQHMEYLEAYKASSLPIRARHSDSFNTQCDQHIDVLLHYLGNQTNISLPKLRAPWKRETPVTTFAALWLLLKPGSDVYVRGPDGSLNAYVLDALLGGKVEAFVNEPIVTKHTAVVWNMSFDGEEVFRRTRLIDIPIFDNEREITSLNVFPTRFIDDTDGGETRKKLIERGRKYLKYSKGPSFLQYSGNGLISGRKHYKRDRVVVEHASHPWYACSVSMRWMLDKDGDVANIGETTRVARCECKECSQSHQQEVYTPLKYSNYDNIHPTKVTELSDHQYLIMSSHMFAFILKDRTYDLLDVAGLSEVQIADNAIDALKMDKKNKDTIQAIAKTYTDTESQTGRFSADFIHGKGEGQIILLHGPPGTGKTLTAESVAEFAKRPLLSITAADLGHEPETLEKNLLRFFRNANDWDAIVLLDEADVYLERRSISDLRRNSIVSIFLRALDYFQGILFLTTNRVGHFDEAFMARIHVSIGYERLDDYARNKIWDNLFQKLKDDRNHGGPEINYDYDAKQYVQRSAEVKELKWNGREIRNAFQTAVALAVYDAKIASAKAGGERVVPEVREQHLKQVVDMSSAFKLYIKSTHEDLDDSDLAYKYGNRDDRFPAGLVPSRTM